MDSATAGPRVGEATMAGCIERSWGASGSSSTSATGGRGVVRVDGLESWIGGDAFLLNKEIIAGKRCQCRSLGIEKDQVTWDDESKSNRTSEACDTHPVSELREGC